MSSNPFLSSIFAREVVAVDEAEYRPSPCRTIPVTEEMRRRDAEEQRRRELARVSAWPLKRELSVTNLRMVQPVAPALRQQPQPVVLPPAPKVRVRVKAAQAVRVVPHPRPPSLPKQIHLCAECGADLDPRAKGAYCKKHVRLRVTEVRLCEVCAAPLSRRNGSGRCRRHPVASGIRLRAKYGAIPRCAGCGEERYRQALGDLCRRCKTAAGVKLCSVCGIKLGRFTKGELCVRHFRATQKVGAA